MSTNLWKINASNVERVGVVVMARDASVAKLD